MSSERLITKDTKISDAIRICPQAANILSSHGMGCCGCLAATAETIEQGAEMHDIDVEKVVDELNNACK